MEAFLFRQYHKTHVFGFLVFGGNLFRTLECPWLDNKPNVSCIPPGRYTVTWLPRSYSGKYRRVWHLHNVEGRSGILIHNGNLVDHTKGCILLGNKHGVLAGKPAVLASRTAMRYLADLTGEDGFNLNIIGAAPCLEQY